MTDLVIAVSSLTGVFVTLMLIILIVNHYKALRTSCIRRDNIPRERRGVCPISCFGYIFDFHTFKENASLPTVERRLDPEEQQLQSYYEAVALERRLREAVNSATNANRQAAEEELQRARIRRTILSARTREMRLRRREERMAQRQQHERDVSSRFNQGLSQEEKQKVLDAILSYFIYTPQRCSDGVDQQAVKQINNQTACIEDSSRSKNIPKGETTNGNIVAEVEKSSSHIKEEEHSSTEDSWNLVPEVEKSSSHIQEEEHSSTEDSCTSDSETSKEEDCEECCAFCLDEFVEGDVLAGRTERCPHTFHKSCLSSWLERKDFCPICRGLILTEKEWKDTHSSFSQNQKEEQVVRDENIPSSNV